MHGHFVFASSVHSHNAIIVSKAITSDNQNISFTESGQVSITKFKSVGKGVFHIGDAPCVMINHRTLEIFVHL